MVTDGGVDDGWRRDDGDDDGAMTMDGTVRCDGDDDGDDDGRMTDGRSTGRRCDDDGWVTGGGGGDSRMESVTVDGTVRMTVTDDDG